MAPNPSPDEIARRCADAMYADDKASQAWGIRLDQVGPGCATLSMTVSDAMLNGHGTCHGGMIFALADTAFAYACNAYNRRTVAQHCAVTFLAPAERGDRLVATCAERVLQGRSGIYDTRVHDQRGQPIAEFRGHSRAIKGKLVEALPGPEEARRED